VIVDNPALSTAASIKFPAGREKVPPELKQHKSGAESAAGGQQKSPAPQLSTVSKALGFTNGVISKFVAVS